MLFFYTYVRFNYKLSKDKKCYQPIYKIETN
jgi:hypothetical protein